MNISIETVSNAIAYLQENNIPVTNRAIRQYLGKGSYSTINKLRRVIENRDDSFSQSDGARIDTIKEELATLKQEVLSLREELRLYRDTFRSVLNDTVDTCINTIKEDITTLKTDLSAMLLKHDPQTNMPASTLDTCIDTVKKRCIELRQQGLSYSEISKTLAQEGFFNANHKPFTVSTLQRWIARLQQ